MEEKMKELNSITAREWEHLKSGHIYNVVAIVENTTNANDGQVMVLYQREGLLFVREANEFLSDFIKRNGRRN